MKTSARIALAVTLCLPFAAATACASCGCSLSSDWDSQGLSAGPGVRLDLRYDFLDQNEVRSGTGKVAAWPIAGHEQELYTRNRYLTAGLDFSVSPNWGLNIQLPYVDRDHGTNGFNFDGTDAGSSHTRSLGDVKLIGRYTGISDAHDIGLQFGLKFATGSHTQTFGGGTIQGDPLDRGLQPGTGTIDAILGAYRFATISQDWDYFAQATAQLPLDSSDQYKPGRSLNLNLGLRYMALGSLVPQLQVNARASAKDAGANASPDDSGGRTVYLSPGATFAVSEQVKVYAFVQVPIYQNLNGYQLAPKSTFSLGTRIEF